MQPLAPYGNLRTHSNTNLSTLISFSLIDKNENDIPVYTTIDKPIEFIIPRDMNMIIPPMILQNLTLKNYSNEIFHFHFINIIRNNNLSLSIHFEMHPIDTNLAYIFIYKFDNIPQWNQFDGWSLFCPSSTIHFSFLLNHINIFNYFRSNVR